jgi:membrane protease YdiL (CAAX protease family)
MGRSVVPPVVVDLYRTPGAAPFLHIAVLIVAPVCEEISARGFLLEGIRWSRLGPVWAVVLSSFAWSALHMQYDVHGIATVFAVGILMGVARVKTGSIYVPIAMHALYNLAATIETFLMLRLY